MKTHRIFNCKCKRCNKSFYTKPFALTRKRGIFCSKKCQYLSMRKRIKKICPICEKEYIVTISTHLGKKAETCSTKCHAISKTGKNNSRWIDGRSYESRKIKGRPIGSKHWNWRGGVTSVAEKIRQSSKYSRFRKSVFERDNYTCKSCNIKGGYLQVEHIKPFSLFPELIFDINNCKTLCIGCHKNTPTFGWKLSKLIRKHGKNKTKTLLYG